MQRNTYAPGLNFHSNLKHKGRNQEKEREDILSLDSSHYILQKSGIIFN